MSTSFAAQKVIPTLGLSKNMGCPRLTYHEKEERNFFHGLWRKSDGSEKSSNYYPFGLVMDGTEITDEAYRYGYQGQFSEKDLTTGWNEFELRMYDARFGRWLSPDPYGQFASPYVGMGNNPVNSVDPDGGLSGPGPGFVLGEWNTTVFLEMAIVVTPKGNYLKNILQGLGAFAFDVYHEMAMPSLTFKQYQQKFPEFAGMDYSEAYQHWNKNYSDKFYKDWKESVRIERINAANEKLRHMESFTVGSSGGPKFRAGRGPRGSSLQPRVSPKANVSGYNSHADLVKALGPAGKGRAWHHIVEQNPANIAKFGPQAIHTKSNVLNLPHGTGTIHNRVTGHYNSLIPGTNMRVRDYVNGLDYMQQRQYGIDVLNHFGWTP